MNRYAELNPRNVYITRDSYGEFRVPAPDGTEDCAYYTDDWEDAKDTCLNMWGDGVCVKRRSVGVHPS